MRIMLSAESASGQFPQEAVATMNRIAETVESEPIYPSIIDAQRATPEATGADAIAGATRDVADILGAKVICAWTTSGSTGLRIARERPRSSILALTPIAEVARRLAVVWGVHAGRHRGCAGRARHDRPRLPPTPISTASSASGSGSSWSPACHLEPREGRTTCGSRL